MAVLHMKTDFVTTLNSSELQLIVRALIGKPRKEDEVAAKALARQITEKRAEQFEQEAKVLRDMLAKAEE